MTSNTHCQFLPSMGAISPLTNVLTGLPMVQPKSVPYGMNNLRNNLCFDEPSPQLCQTIAQALSSADTSWVSLKPGLGIPTTPMEPCPTTPALIHAIINTNCLYPQHSGSVKQRDGPECQLEDSRSAKRQMKSPAPLTLHPSPIHTVPQQNNQLMEQDKSVKKGGRKRNHSHNTNNPDSQQPVESVSPSNIENVAPKKDASQATPQKSDIININISLGRLKVTRSEVEQRLKITSPTPEDNKPSRSAKRKSKTKSHHDELPEFKSRDARESEELVNEQALSNFRALIDRLIELESKHISLRQQLTGDELKGECLLPSFQLEQLSTESWKLGRVGLMSRLHTDTLLSVLSCMQRHISDAQGIDLSAVPRTSGSPAEGKKWRALSVERIGRATEAAQTILAISGGSGLGPAMVVEEILETVLEHARFHLVTNIYSEMDPSYRYTPQEQEEEVPSEFVIHVGGRVSKQKTAKAKKGFSFNRWDLTLLYFKLAELLESMSVLAKSCVLTDTLVLQLSSLALKPFFVENNSTLQLSALKLARNIFSKYPKHRPLMLEEIFQSLAKLPSSKRTLRTYHLGTHAESGEESQGKSIQMVTALVMQLLQSIAVVSREKSHLETEEQFSGTSLDADLISSIDEVFKTGQNFLTTLFKKCYASAPSKSEVDFRPIFEEFVQNLLTTLLLPHWPVSGTLLSIMCRLFLVTFTNKQAELSMRLAALEHVGNIISQSRSQMADHEARRSPPTSPTEDTSMVCRLVRSIPQEVRNKVLSSLQMKECMEIDTDTEYETKALASFLLLLHLREREEDSCLISFWVGTWVRELAVFAEKEKSVDAEECLSLSPSFSSAREQALREFYQRLLTDTDPFKSASKIGFKVTSHSATCLVRFLTANLPLLRNFSFYLNHLIRMVNETNVQIRTRAMKSLSSVLSVDPSLIGSSDLKNWIRTRMCDMSSMVRETTVELVGRSLQQRAELATEFYDILSERMLDTSVAVRKRVIRILRDSIHKMPPVVHTDLCVKLVMRVQEEKSVQQLIVGMFQDLWFSPLSPGDKEEEKKRAQSICNVVFALDEAPGFVMVLELFTLLLKPDNVLDQQKMIICKRITDSLVESILQLDEQGATLAKMIPMNATLHLFSIIDGSLLVSHLTALQPYLASQCSNQGELIGLTHLLKAFSNVLPLLLSHKLGPQFLASTEENLMKLSMVSGSMIVEASLACLAALINSVTHNYKLVQDCFSKFSEYLERSHTMLLNNSPQLAQLKPIILRSLFTVGLLCRYFEIDNIISKTKEGILPTRRVFSKLMYFAKQNVFPDCQEKSLVGLGFFFLAHPNLMLEDEAIELYSECLSSGCVAKKCQVLTNLTNHLQEDEERLKRADKEWKKEGNDQGTLQDIGDKQSTLSSTMIQRFLPYVMNAFFTPEVRVRSHITNLLSMVLRQGLIYPAPCISCLVAMVTDCNPAIREKAELLLEEMSHSNKLMHTQVVLGIRKSFDFLEVISSGLGLIRGREGMESKLLPIYHMVQNNRQQRRAFLLTMVRLFDDVDKQGVPFLLYVADNLACFSYSLMGELLFVIHHISVHLSMAGPALIDSFQDSMGLKTISSQQGQQTLDESAMLDTEALLRSETCDDSRLATSVYHSYAIILLLHLSAYLKATYSLTEVRCHEYIPTAPSKMYDKPISRKVTPNIQFEPTEVVEALELSHDGKLVVRTRSELLQRFHEFYKLYKAIEVEGGDSLPETYQHTIQSYSELFAETNEISEAGQKKPLSKDKDNSIKPPKKKPSKTNKLNKGGKLGTVTQSPKEKRKSIRSKRKFNYFESSDDSDCGSSNNEDL